MTVQKQLLAFLLQECELKITECCEAVQANLFGTAVLL